MKVEKISPTNKKIAGLLFAGLFAHAGLYSADATADTCITAANPVHEYEGRATWYYYYGYQYNAVGSGTYIGGYYGVTSLKQTAPGYWTLVASCANNNAAPTLSNVTAADTDNDSTINVSAQASDSDGSVSSVTVSINGGTEQASAFSSGSWRWESLPLADGTYSVAVVATDDDGASSNAWTGNVVISSEPDVDFPTVTITSPANNEEFDSGSSVLASGTSDDLDGTVTSVTGTLDGNAVTVTGTNNWSINLDNLADGDYTLAVTAKDNDNQSTTKSVDFSVGESACDPDDLNLNAIASAKSTVSANANMHAFIVKHCGVIVDSWFKSGYGLNTPHELQSATKTVSAMVLGNLMYNEPQKFPQGVNTPLKDVLPTRYAQYFQGTSNAWKQQITIKDVLRMTTGLFWDDGISGGTSSFVEIEDNTNSTTYTSIDYILSRNQFTDTTKSYGKFFYNTGSSHLVSAIVHYNADGLTTAEYADANLFNAVGAGTRRIPNAASDIQGGTPGTNGADYSWPVTPDGIHTGGWASNFKPSVFNKLGEVLLSGGVWNGQRLIAADFVAQMTSQQISAGTSGYGYQMWIPAGYGTPVAAARGWGGQETHVLPELDMVVTFLGNSAASNAGTIGSTIDGWMKNQVLPAHSAISGGGSGGGTGTCVTATNSQHQSAGRATSSYSYYYAVGSQAYMGYGGTVTTSLKQTSPGYWQIETGGCS